MNEAIQPVLVVAAAVIGGSALGHYITMRLCRKATSKVVGSIIGQATMATSVIGTLYIDAMIEHAKMTPQQAADALMKGLHAAGVPVKGIHLGERHNVHTTH